MDLKDDIQLCSNETLKMILKNQRESNNNFKKIAITCVVGWNLTVMIFVGGVFYFLNEYEVGVVKPKTETTIQEVAKAVR